jgi:hypothetical protein
VTRMNAVTSAVSKPSATSIVTVPFPF